MFIQLTILIELGDEWGNVFFSGSLCSISQFIKHAHISVKLSRGNAGDSVSPSLKLRKLQCGVVTT